MATQDEKGFTIFVIATFRGHFETARLILSIADAQFKGWDNTKVQRRYEIAGTMNDDSEGEEDEEDDSSADGNSDNLDISSRVIDDTYTYDNIAELQDAVDSKVSGKSSSESIGISTKCLGENLTLGQRLNCFGKAPNCGGSSTSRRRKRAMLLGPPRWMLGVC